jgi:hypothetical protein
VLACCARFTATTLSRYEFEPSRSRTRATGTWPAAANANRDGERLLVVGNHFYDRMANAASLQHCGLKPPCQAAKGENRLLQVEVRLSGWHVQTSSQLEPEQLQSLASQGTAERSSLAGAPDRRSVARNNRAADLVASGSVPSKSALQTLPFGIGCLP